MNLLVSAPLVLILLKWSGLLALGWAVHALLRHRHARWRVLLWRSLLCAGLILPLTAWVTVPGLRIPVMSASLSESADASSPATVEPGPLTRQAMPAPAIAPTKTFGTPIQHPSPVTAPTSKTRLLLLIWAVVAVAGSLRLLRWHWQLSRLCRAAHPPTPDVLQTAEQIRRRLRVNARLSVRVSAEAASPFACGLFKPVIIIPQSLAQDLSSAEISTLLSHEIAHFRQHDLVWCVAWRWTQALCWFHPLVWGIPAAHGLACEQEADRIASAQLPDRDSYAQLLARLALRILALPAVETRLTVNGSSEIARRLRHLTFIRQWDWRYAAPGLILATIIFAATAGCRLTHNQSAAVVSPARFSFDKVLVVVHDENGQPVVGATVMPDGFRVKGLHGADAYGWSNIGPPEKFVTDDLGRAWVKYPVNSIPEEKEYTGALILMVTHPGFAPIHIQTYLVDGSESPIQMQRGLLLRVSAWYGSDRQPVPEVVFNLNQEGLQPDDWQKQEDGTWTFHKLSPGGHIIRAMGRLPSGQILFSEARAFSAANNGKILYLEMKPGIRIEGRLDDRVPRPVKNGRVLIDVRPPPFPAWTNFDTVDAIRKQYPNVNNWRTYRPIAEDGTFVFESVPPGGLDVVAMGNGFVSKSGGVFGNISNGQFKPARNFCLPQPFALTAPVTQVEVATEPSATLEIHAQTGQGRAVPGIEIGLNPNVVRMNGIFGMMGHSDEAPFNNPPRLSILYDSKTDAGGIAVFTNVPACAASLYVTDTHYQVPLQDLQGWRNRVVHLSLSAGQTNHLDLTLEPVGSDFIGDRLGWK